MTGICRRCYDAVPDASLPCPRCGLRDPIVLSGSESVVALLPLLLVLLIGMFVAVLTCLAVLD